jgi:hypothetical protein
MEARLLARAAGSLLMEGSGSWGVLGGGAGERGRHVGEKREIGKELSLNYYLNHLILLYIPKYL